MSRSVRLFVIGAGWFATVFAAAAVPPGRLSKRQAEDLVRAAVPAKTKQLPQFGLEEYDDPARPRFFFYTAYWAGTEGGSVVAGQYAVDASTGDVWDAVVSCKEERNSALRSLQAEVRERMGLSQGDYLRMKSKGPLCE